MAEECTHDCSTCSKSCGERKEKFDFAAKLNAASKVGTLWVSIQPFRLSSTVFPFTFLSMVRSMISFQ